MDMSKLPKLSQSPRPTPSPQPVEELPGHTMVRAEPAGPEAFVSIAIGLLLLLLQPGLLTYIFGGNPGNVFDEKGAPMRYIDSVFFFRDLVIAAFAVTLIAEGLIIAFTPKAPLVLFALILTLITTAANLLYFIMTFSTYGVPILSALAVIFGVYIALYEWRVYQNLRLSQLD